MSICMDQITILGRSYLTSGQLSNANEIGALQRLLASDNGASYDYFAFAF